MSTVFVSSLLRHRGACFSTLAILLVSSVINPLRSQEKPGEALPRLTLDDLLNTTIDVGTGRSTSIYDAPSTVTIIDRDMIEKFHFRTLSDALSTVAGISILRTTSRQEVITARGILQDHYPNKVLFLLDGVPSWNPTTNEMGSLNRVDIADVERVEVLRGPASVVYGTNA